LGIEADDELVSSFECKITPRKKYFLLPKPPLLSGHPGLREAPGLEASGKWKEWVGAPFLGTSPSAHQTHIDFGERIF